MQQCERAIFDLRRGVGILVLADDGDRFVVPVETGTARSRRTLERSADGPASLLLARERMIALGITDVPEAARVEAPADEDRLRRLAWGDVSDAALPAPPASATRAETAAVVLLKRALMIPAALSVPVAASERDRLIAQRVALDVRADEVAAAARDSASRVRRISEAAVPLETSVQTRFILFREPDGLREHVAVQIGEPDDWPAAVPVRLHSACLTGDLFGSLRCDCGEQLRGGVKRIADAGGGVLLYLAQEGRGIGLANKLRAYTRQDRGADTVEADASLGFAEDERRYDVAVQMLLELGIDRVRLLTNNPAKIAAIEAGGIAIDDREELYGRLTEHNERYLRAKADRSGHLLDEWLETESASD